MKAALILYGAVVKHYLWGEPMKYGHLELVKVKLKTLTPVFIGSGEKFDKEGIYIFDRQRKLIYIPDLGSLLDF